MLLVRELIGGTRRGKPGGPIPLAAAPADAAAGRLSVRWYGHSSALDRGRRLPGARRSGVESTVLAVADGGPAAAA